MKFSIASLAPMVFCGMLAFAQSQDAQETPEERMATQADVESLRDALRRQSMQIEHLANEVARLADLMAPRTAAPKAATPVAAAVRETVPAEVVPTPEPEAVATPVDGITHEVAMGETLTAIAKQYGVSVGQIMSINSIKDPRKLRMGQTILIPNPATPAPNP